tara:strand:- start:6209 stop:7078 length:870 start_codon:yes stop_codon:yes gene_type:complete
MSVFGFSGTISSLILAATIPHFLFSNINSEKDFLQLFYQPIMLCSLLLILFSAYLYIDVKDILDSYYYLGEYFIIASINYVPLLFSSFCVIVYLLFRAKIKQIDNKLFHSLFFILLVLLTAFYSMIFLTRTVVICSLFLLFAHFEKTRIYFILLIPIIMIYNIDVIFLEVIKFFGSDTMSVIASDNRRFDSVTNLINSSLSFDFDFRNKMSFSSLINLLFSLFPLTLVFLYNPFKTLIIIFNRRDVSLFSVFLSCLVLVTYQMDFFSIFSFFFFMEYVKTLFINEKHAS